MKVLPDLLRDADPLRYEAMWSPQERLRVEQRALAGISEHQGTYSRRRLLSAVAAVLTVAAVAVGSRFPVQAAVRLEVRLAETAPAPGLMPVTPDASGQPIYVHPEAIVLNGDIAKTTVVPAANGFSIDVTFSPSGAQKLFAATSRHIGKPVAILIDGRLVAAPTLRSPIRDAAQITGNFTRAEAERLANGMIGK